MHLQLFNPYKKFRDHKISFEYHKIDFTLDSNNKNKINTVDYKETYIDANKNLHSVVVSAATDMYINNNDSNKNVLLEFSRKISDRYYCILKAYNDYMEKRDKKNKTDNVTLTKIKNLNLNQILTTENKYLIQTIKDYVTCDGASNKYFGNAGSTPQTWILYFENKFIGQENFIEFRHRLFFVYKLMGFMNSCIQNEILIKELNKIIKSKYNLNMDDWCINVEYAQYLNHRCENTKKKIPVYKTGPAASLNVFLRQGIDNDDIYLERKNNLDIASYQDIADKKFHSYSPKLFDVVISEREAMALTGDLKKDIRNTPNSKRPISYISGALTYEYISNPANKDAQKYLEIAKELCLPIICGISGTMDYSLSMAALVFLGIKNKKQDLEYQNIIKLAYITWMSIGYDHTLHEMLFSATSYGIPYIPGPYIVDYIYPNDIDFKLKIEEKLKEIGLDLPSNILKDFILTKNITNSIVGKSIFALESIAKCSGIVRMVPMQQIKDEVYNLEFPNIRHLGRKSVGTKDRTKIYDPSTQLTSTRTVNSNRFTNKNTEFTKKYAQHF
ncbi:hypothetical protein GCL60_06465 [Silvanigrella paludirubra]|uniref:Uncharacterized protein n=1 Tax=Silvanigrella paludirubra TaxID=2499159 RepID=A0A6N6VU96_9BACT|nr:hypothetical protein [Silvanigrella paludirubra]KAB8039900.1 hypothetical protein GCL60_06465 [Silvanigrella paludirubra]